MKMSDSRKLAAEAPAVWAALMDPEVLKACVPGCKEMSGSADDGFDATVVQKVGPVQATFKGRVTLSNRVEPESLSLTGEGKGGAAGFAKGGADIRLEAVDGGTVLHYDVDARVGGKLAQLGSRIVDGFAKKMAEQFFERFQTAVEGPTAEAESADPPHQSADPPQPAPTAAPKPEPKPEPEPEPAKKNWFQRVFG